MIVLIKIFKTGGMKCLLLLLLTLIIPVEVIAFIPDSTRTKLKAACTISLNTNGISTIPAFSLGEPAIMSFITLSKGRFSYDPVLAYGMDIKPWFIDNWLHYHIVDRDAFKLRTGINFSVFFSDVKLPEEEILKGERYWAVELAGIYNITSRTVLTLMYWNDRGQDPGTLMGHFLSLSGEHNEMRIGKFLLLSAALQIFYIDYDGNNDGLFVSPKISLSGKSISLALFFQATQPLVTNISPYPGFEWNLGVSYGF
jgi:hypothetical protein